MAVVSLGASEYGATEYGAGEDEFKTPMAIAPVIAEEKPRPSITDMMKNPSKVVLMKVEDLRLA